MNVRHCETGIKITTRLRGFVKIQLIGQKRQTYLENIKMIGQTYGKVER